MRKKHKLSRTQSEAKVFAVGGLAGSQTTVAQPPRTEVAEDFPISGEWRSVYLLVPAILALITSINTLWNDFASDDLQMVLNNTLIKDLSNIPRAFMVSGWGFTSEDIRFALDTFYRPVLNVLLTISYALFGTAPWGWHLVNVLVHTTVTVLVFLVLNALTERKWVSLIAATLFAVHPVHSESIAWVSGLTDPSMAMFVLSSFYFYVTFRRTGHKYRIAIAALLFLFALLSKETALAMLLMVAYCEFFYFDASAALKQRLIRAARVAGVFLFPYGVYFLLRYLALGTPALRGEAINPLDYVLKSIPLVMVKYLKLALVPFGYSFQHYTPFVSSFVSFAFIGPILVVAAAVAAVWMTRSRILALASAWFVVWLAPSLAVLRQYEPESIVQERFLYLPSIGFCLAIALGIEWLATHSSRGRRPAAAIALALVVLWSFMLVQQNRVWRNNITLYQNCVAVEPNSPAARSALALTYSAAGRFREAEEQARAGLSLDPQHLGSYLNLSYKAKQLGRIDEAIQHLETAVSTVSEAPLTRTKLATIYLNLGMLYGEQKKFNTAEQRLLRSIEIWPRPAGWYYTGMNHFYQGQYQQAIAMFEEVRRHVPPSYALIHLTIGGTYEKMGEIQNARAEYEKYLELAPSEAPEKQSVREKLKEFERGSVEGKP